MRFKVAESATSRRFVLSSQKVTWSDWWHRLAGVATRGEDMAEAHPDADFGGLMAAANAGQSEAYARLLRALTPILRQLIRRRRGFAGSDDVEDLVQDVLLSVHSARATYDPSRPFMPWLLAIVQHRIADASRRHARQAAREVAFDETSVTFAAAETNTFLDDFAAADALRAAVQGLPRGQRQAIELLKLQEMSLSEASAATGTSVGALKVATHRAMAALRGMLKKNGH
jgi:RNA polymerase sigma factor (sigma-70 family)